jgi:ribonuclease P/MRP protein subunit POP1
VIVPLCIQLGLPGDKLQPLNEDDRVPLVLIQKSLSSSTTPADQDAAVHGYTILLPAGWAMPFWQSFVFTGSRISGLDERTTQCLEAGVPAFPECYPQTRAGAEWRADELKERKRRWDRRPPGKRFEYDVLGAHKPWELEWDVSISLSEGATIKPWLVPEWLLQGIEASTRVESTDYEAIFWRVFDKCRAALGLSPLPLADRQSVWDSALVQATVTIVGRGSPKDFGEIYPVGPNERDQLLGDANAGVSESSLGRVVHHLG